MTIVESKAYWPIVLTLVALVSVASWQFHSLAWGGDMRRPAVEVAEIGSLQTAAGSTAFR